MKLLHFGFADLCTAVYLAVMISCASPACLIHVLFQHHALQPVQPDTPFGRLSLSRSLNDLLEGLTLSGDRQYRSESDVYHVYRRQIMKSKVDPRSERVKYL